MKFEKTLVILFSLAILFIATSVSAQTTSGDTCKISLSLTTPPISVVAGSGFPKVSVSGSFNANEKCIPPFNISLLGDLIGGQLPDTDKHSDSFKKDFTLTGHSARYEESLHVVDSCGSYNSISVSDDINAKTHITTKISDGSKTFYNPTNVILEELKVSDIVSASVDFDPTYLAETIRDRHYTPKKPFSPLDTVQVKIIVKITGCQPNIEQLRSTLFMGAFVTTDVKGKKINLALENFSLLEPYTGGNAVFVLKLPLISPWGFVENTISSIAEGRPVSVEIYDATLVEPKNVSVPIIIPLKMTNCAQTYGSGQNKVVYMRAAVDAKTDSKLKLDAKYTLSKFITLAESVRTDGFEKVDPFKSYSRADHGAVFSHFSDLQYNDSSNMGNDFDSIFTQRRGGLGLTASKYNAFFDFLKYPSSCPSGIKIVLAQFAPSAGVSSLGGNGLFVDINVEEMASVERMYQVTLPIVVIHEFGHAFGGLDDEYDKGGAEFGREMEKVGLLPLKNCSTVPRSAWTVKGVVYGDTKWRGCGSSGLFRGGKAVAPDTVALYRPSEKSMMKAAQSGETRFNVISCGYIIARIKGGNASKYWSECMKLDTVKPTEKISFTAPLEQMFSWLDNLTGLSDDQFAATGKAPVPTESPRVDSDNSRFLIYESFDPKDPWSEIVEVGNDSSNSVVPIDPIKPQVTLTSNKTLVSSTENVDIKVTYPNNTTKTALYISCPTGISSLLQGFECNKLISLSNTFKGTTISFTNITNTVQKVILKFSAVTSLTSIESLPLIISINPNLLLAPPPPPAVKPVIDSVVTPTPTYIQTYTPTVTSSPTYSPSPTITSTPSPTTTTSPSATASPSPTTSSSPTPTPTYSPSSSPNAYLPTANQNASIWQAIVEWLGSF